MQWKNWKKRGFNRLTHDKQTAQLPTLDYHQGASDVLPIDLFLSAVVVFLISQNWWSSILLTAVPLKEGKQYPFSIFVSPIWFFFTSIVFIPWVAMACSCQRRASWQNMIYWGWGSSGKQWPKVGMGANWVVVIYAVVVGSCEVWGDQKRDIGPWHLS